MNARNAQLPTGWKIKDLGEIYSFKNGINFDKTQKIGKGILTLDVLNMYCHGLKVNTSNLYRVQKQISEDYKLKNGDILIVRSSVKEEGVAWATYFEEGNEPITYCGFIIRGRPLISVNAKYVVYYLRSHEVRKELIKRSIKSTITNINQAILSEVKIPLPPLTEQRRIVAILDEAFAAIAKAKANAEQNLKNAKELFESYLHGVFKNKGEGWVQKRLGDVAHTNGRIGWKGLTAKEYKTEGPLFLSVHSLNYGDYVDFREAYHISQARYDESPEIMLQEEDILICKDGAGIGKLGIVPKLPSVATINSSLLLIRCKDKVKSKYLYYFLLSPAFQSIVQSRLMGATTPHLYQRDIVTFPIFIPNLKEQDSIVEKLDILSSQTKNLETIYKQKLLNLEELKKSILNKAFSGELNTSKICA
jgi:type I restriction enzyme S subunit